MRAVSVHSLEVSMSRIFLAGVLLAFSVPALAGSFAGSSAGASSAGSSASSDSSSGDDKIVVQAREDAASFVASDGRIRGAQLEAVLRHLREKDEAARKASDMQLAQAILAR
jgi:uncharacterized protein (TIGR02448 family)